MDGVEPAMGGWELEAERVGRESAPRQRRQVTRVQYPSHGAISSR